MYTRIRKGPFFYAHQRHGVQSYTVTNRQYHPRHYDDMLVEYWPKGRSRSRAPTPSNSPTC
jgi:aminomethyltransferase